MNDWHPEDIKAQVRKRGLTLAQLARNHDVPEQQIRHALVIPREQAERVIADFLGVSPKVIWPSRYHLNGRRKRPQPPENYSRMPRFHNWAEAV